MNKSRLSPRTRAMPPSVFGVYTELALKHNAVNLGQGFPDFAPPQFVMDAYRRAATADQQYSLPAGTAELREELVREYEPRFGSIDPMNNVQIVAGATEALFVAFQALVNPGDEVILFEPFYDSYPAGVIIAGGTPKYVPLVQENGSWRIDQDGLRAVFSRKTKAIVVNSPHNPTGAIFTREEMELIVSLAEEHDAIIISDEVYEHIAWEPHVSIGTFPGAWDRTLTISSIGKTFSATGWKIGWLVGPEDLIAATRSIHQWITFCIATPLQLAVADILKETRENGYIKELHTEYTERRQTIVDGLSAAGLTPLQPQGSYFVLADISSAGYEDDVAFCKALPETVGVVAIPPSAFYSDENKHLAKGLARFSFSKTNELLMQAAERLAKLNQ